MSVRLQDKLTFASDDEEDEAAELMRELEKIKKERQAQKEKEVLTFIKRMPMTECLHEFSRNLRELRKNKSNEKLTSQKAIPSSIRKTSI